jgi:hypothetical protein
VRNAKRSSWAPVSASARASLWTIFAMTWSSESAALMSPAGCPGSSAASAAAAPGQRQPQLRVALGADRPAEAQNRGRRRARLRRQRLDRQARGRGRIVEDGGGDALLGGLQPGKRAADAHQHGTWGRPRHQSIHGGCHLST